LTSARLGSAAIVVETPDSSLAVLVIASPAVNEPEGIVIVIVVELGLEITEAVVPLLPPVMVLPTTRSVEAPTVAVMVPIGYVAIEELVEYLARDCVISSTVHKFRPLLAHSANKRFKERRAVLAS
tara:strand:- start:1 stop:378 length:378 start_codon:yes stop_codon:yes gene_type:complete